MIHHVVAHFVSHHRLNLLRRSTLDQVVIQRDAHGVAESAYVGAHACGLSAGVNFPDVVGGDAIGVRHAQNRCSDLRVIELFGRVEDGLKKHGSDGN